MTKKNLSLSGVIKIVAVVLTSGLLIIMASTYYQLREVQKKSVDVSKQVEGIQIALEVRFHIVQIQQFLTDASLMKDEDGVKEAYENLEAVQTKLKTLATLMPNDQLKADEISIHAKKLFDTGVEMFRAYQEKGHELGDLIMKRPETGLDAVSEILSNQVTQFVDNYKSNVENAQRSLDKIEKEALYTIIGVSLTLSFFLLAMLFRIYSRVTPVSNIVQILRSRSTELSNSSSSLVSISSDLNNATEKEASALHESAAALEEITAMTRKTESGVMNLNELANKSASAAEDGLSVFRQIVSQMGEVKVLIKDIMTEVENGNGEIGGIISMVLEIENKTKIINDIVFQTKLLSFNASVEAARAGEHGKGFAVVAEEVGNLAVMSGKASKEISDLLSSSTKKIDEIVKGTSERLSKLMLISEERMNSSFDSLNIGSDKVEGIARQVAEVQSFVVEISAAIQEQTKGVSEVAAAVTLLQSTSNNVVNSATNSGKVAGSVQGSASELGGVASNLEELVNGRIAS